MRRRLLSFLAAIALATTSFAWVAVSAPIPAFANPPGGICAALGWTHHWSTVDQFQGQTGSRGNYPFNEVAGYIYQLPAVSNSNNWRHCEGALGDSGDGFNSTMVSLDAGNGSDIAQIGIAVGSICGWHTDTPAFFYTINPNDNGGQCIKWTLVDGGNPQAGHNYYLRVYNYTAGSYNYWYYCANDLTDGSGTVCLAQINSSGFRSASHIWIGSETANTNDTMGQYVPDPAHMGTATYLWYSFHDRQTNEVTGVYPQLSCSAYPTNDYYCVDTTWNGNDAFAPYTIP